MYISVLKLNVSNGNTNIFAFHILGLKVCVPPYRSIPPLRFVPAGTDPAEMSVSAVINITREKQKN